MTETVKNNSGVKGFLLRTLADPVLIYVTVVMTSIMHHYRAELTAAYCIASYAAGWVIFRIFDFINKHHIIGTFAYIALASGFIFCTREFIDIGHATYPIGWGLWFLTPQDSLEYNKWYTLAIFMLFLIFMLSVIYYFTRVRYRIFMNFLILIIPFAIYGKEAEELPLGYIIALCIGYVLILALFRQLSDNENSVVVDKREAWRSAAAFTILFALLASLIPKPKIVADRTMIETMINADAFTDRLVEMLNVFRDTSDGEQFRNAGGENLLYYGKAPEPLHLKTATYTTYDFSSDSWKISNIDTDELTYGYTLPLEIYDTFDAADSIYAAAAIDSDFAEKYGLSDYLEMDIKYPELSTATIYAATYPGKRAPAPGGTVEFTGTSYQGVVCSTPSGIIKAKEGDFAYEDSFTFQYASTSAMDSFSYRIAVAAVSNIDDYAAMLEEASYILSDFLDSDHLSDEEYEECFHKYVKLRSHIYSYSQAMENLMDYGGQERIRQLAEQITDGCISDFDKAKALEWYFYNNNYTYDQKYKKPGGDNVLNFLFDSKTGVCYEYATAMTLMARSVGIPARYCEGYNMQDETEWQNGQKGYTVKAKDAHGFPELYIRGYGWMNFEPTMTDAEPTAEERKTSSVLWEIGIFILIFSLAGLLFIIIYPMLAHRMFILINSRRKPNEAVRAALRRTGKLYGMTSADTSHQTEEAVRRRSGADISEMALLFDRSEYGGQELAEENKSKATELYIAAFNALREAKKQERKNKRKNSR